MLHLCQPLFLLRGHVYSKYGERSMYLSKVYPRTRREDPRDATSPGTINLIRAGFVSKVTSGIWTWTSLGLRVRRKVEAIVREEMETIGAVELELPILQPRELWEQTNRWDKYTQGRTAFATTDRSGNQFLMAPTAEEVITAFAAANLTSYKDLPMTFWQMSPKFRDEMRPRQGLIRGREFLMKDAYSFSADQAGMKRAYDDMAQAYKRIFKRCGFEPFLWVEADSGAIGGSGSTEFMAVTQYGEDFLLNCPLCHYGANQEKASTVFTYEEVPLAPLEHIDTPNIRTVVELEEFINLRANQMVKTIVLVADGDKPVIVSMRGDLEISEVKLANLLGAQSVETAHASVVEEITRAPVGFAGPINLFDRERIFNGQPVPYFFDQSVEGLRNFLCGGNETDVHYVNVNTGRDFPEPEKYYDLSKVVDGQRCPRCQGTLQLSKGIELGHIFQLQQVYSEPMNAVFADKDNQPIPFWMGCYGIGVSRIVQAIMEQHYDEKGLIWPIDLAPFKMVVIPANKRLIEDASGVYRELNRQFPNEVMLDDLGRSFGASMTDAELIGYPFQLIVGRSWDEQKLEVKIRDQRKLPDRSNANVTARQRAELMTVEEFTSYMRMSYNNGQKR
ncbi:MAG: proline--tRNA ligase [Candidatus Magasanikbacteria bacterium CG_4_9_14_0_2_um_filter_41_10]|uniref:Proline--tRNA ligase n=1 Tax=Candidatus Magasanikbacteria bacterium CG_4_10_14_0_2_um_filter_41_31 TaxID=1974639 RepID=A0A2M7V4Q2_9BACT|nr:MAG: proline--tRNA ligase [Candidatus Magasanikbacteria bacterium CG_4_10_14_0_2_um_filter_41_31]PJC53336.1 MAG: proline--tRNA ligase [Candidatus Magasanikbacteria bacterium CG_4_9_14_0_2_um_filter_41_10]